VTFSSALANATYAIEITVTSVPTGGTPDFRPCYNITSKTASGFTFTPIDCRGGTQNWDANSVGTVFDWLAIVLN